MALICEVIAVIAVIAVAVIAVIAVIAAAVIAVACWLQQMSLPVEVMDVTLPLCW